MGATPAAALLLRRISHLATGNAAARDQPTLTQREREIARFIAEGLSNKEISRRLEISVATVKNHVHSILSKMHLKRRGQVAWRIRIPEPK